MLIVSICFPPLCDAACIHPSLHDVLQVEVEPVIVIFPTFSLGRSQVLLKPNPSSSHCSFPVLTQLASLSTHPSQHTHLETSHHTLSSTSSSTGTSSPSALVLSFPRVFLESAKSHVLDEPVPRHARADTLPWDCSMTDASFITVTTRCPRYLLEPLAGKASLAAQQEGVGLTVHSESIVVALSRKQVCAICKAESAKNKADTAKLFICSN